MKKKEKSSTNQIEMDLDPRLVDDGHYIWNEFKTSIFLVVS